MFEDEMDYLRRFDPNIALIEPHDSPDPIPDSWRTIFSLPDHAQQVKALMSLWPQVLPTQMPKTIDFVREHTQQVRLARFGGRTAILYGLVTERQQTTYYAGGNPLSARASVNAALISKLPASVANFYFLLHDGFYYYPSEDGGLYPANLVSLLGAHEWQVSAESLDEPLRIDPATTVLLFGNGGGGYLGYDYQAQLAVEWWDDDQPEYHDSLWAALDEFTLISLEN